jgi:hypothetical protein
MPLSRDRIDELTQSARERRAWSLLKFAKARPAGFTNEDAMAHFGWPLAQFNIAVHDLRRLLAEDGDTVFLPCEPQGHREDWRYWLADGRAVVDAELSEWRPNRIHDTETRVITLEAGLRVAQVSTRGNTKIGRKARVMRKQLGRLVEDLAEIDAS